MHIANDNPDLFEYGHTYALPEVKEEDIPEQHKTGLRYSE